MAAVVTAIVIINPRVSTKICRLRPFIFLPASNPREEGTAGCLHTLRICASPLSGVYAVLFSVVSQNAKFRESDTKFHPAATSESNDKQFAISDNPLAAFAIGSLSRQEKQSH